MPYNIIYLQDPLLTSKAGEDKSQQKTTIIIIIIIEWHFGNCESRLITLELISLPQLSQQNDYVWCMSFCGYDQ